jgi:hypothetical protein
MDAQRKMSVAANPSAERIAYDLPHCSISLRLFELALAELMALGCQVDRPDDEELIRPQTDDWRWLVGVVVLVANWLSNEIWSSHPSSRISKPSVNQL